MTQPHDDLYASKLFQEWLTALKERAMLQTHHQSQAMVRSVLHNVAATAAWDFSSRAGGQPIRHPSVRQTSFCKKLSKTCHRIPSRRIRS
jgi:hypothetical protein